MFTELYFKLRSLGRRTGANRMIMRLASRGKVRRMLALREEYHRTRPKEVLVDIGGYQSRMMVADSFEYASLLAPRETKVAQWLFTHVSSGDTVWDVGANVGLYTCALAQAVSPSGTVVAFEPYPPCFERLNQNIRLNTLDNVRTVCRALGSANTLVNFRPRASATAGGHTLVCTERDAGSVSTKLEQVSVCTGDSFGIEHQLAVPRLLKIDVEGAEVEVLLGLRETTANHECRAIIVEVHCALLERNGIANGPTWIGAYLKSHGFTRQRWLDREHLVAER